MSAELDAKFEQCVTPLRFNEQEATLMPHTLFALSEDTSARIADLIAASQTDQSAFRCFPFEEFTILWLVTAEGEILIAMEEAVSDDVQTTFSGPTTFPLPIAVNSKHIRLGHPSMVGCKPARIGGEIICDLGEQPPKWYLSNRSGRYGLNLGRTRQQLMNVAEEFERLEIELDLDFM